MDALLLNARMSTSGSSSSFDSSDNEDPPKLILERSDMPPPPPPESPPPDNNIMPPPDSPPPCGKKCKPIKSRQTTKVIWTRPDVSAMLTPKHSPVKQQEKEVVNAYSDESDVFDEDIEAILFAEEEEDRRKGYTDCLIESHLDSTEYPFPAYLVKLSTLFTEENAFGKSPENYIYCNNLVVSPYQLKLLDVRASASEQETLKQVRRAAEVAAKKELYRRRQQRRIEALESPVKKIKISEATLKALEAKPSASMISLKNLSNPSKKRVRRKPASSAANTKPVASTSSHPTGASAVNCNTFKLTSSPAKIPKGMSKANGESSNGQKMLACSGRTKKVTTATVKRKAAAATAKTPKSVMSERAKPKLMAASSNSRVLPEMEKTRVDMNEDPGNESSSSASSSSTSSSSSSSSSSTSETSSGVSGDDTKEE
ncbi:hypothetical protein Plhal304r1_c026g0088551 [Plasmopara halstedii]